MRGLPATLILFLHPQEPHLVVNPSIHALGQAASVWFIGGEFQPPLYLRALDTILNIGDVVIIKTDMVHVWN